MVDILSLLAAIGGIGGLATIIGVAFWLGRKFSEIDMQFRMIDERFKMIDERFKQIDKRFEEIDKRFEQIDERFEQVNRRFERIERRLNKIEEKLKEHDSRFDKIEKEFEYRLKRGIGAVINLTAEVNEMMLEFLSTKHLVTREELDFLRRRAFGITEVITSLLNPLTKKEWLFIRKVFSKDIDEMTIEELQQTYKLGKKLLLEDWDHRGYIIAIASKCIMLYLMRKQEIKAKEKKEQK